MRLLSLVALLLLAPALSGCVVESLLRADGSGKLRVEFRLDEKAALGSVSQRLESGAVVLRGAHMDRQRNATFKVEFDDVTKVSTTEMFKNVTVTRVPGAKPGTTDWSAKLVQAKPFQLSEKVLQQFGSDLTVRITFPGPVVATNATSHEGATAKWVIPLQTVTSSPETVFTATYASADAPGAGG